MKNLLLTLEEIKELLTAQHIKDKEILTFSEAVTFLALSDSALYKKTSRREIPHYKPSGKIIYFKKSELQEWMLANRIASVEELSGEALSIFSKDKKEVKNAA